MKNEVNRTLVVKTKRTYIQPEVNTAVMPKYAMMGDSTALAVSSSMGTVGGGAPSWRRNQTRTPVF